MTGPRLPPAEDPEVLLERIAGDPARPRFHFTAPTGWLNDPNGLCQRDGTHHLFYQYNPGGGFHDRIQWGHATSSDLVHWTNQPVALRPGDGPDADGCWSGVLVDDGGIPTLVYSGRAAGVELPCLATGSADLLTWTKDPANPVIPEPPRSGLSGFRDHCVWREGDRWRMLIGAGVSEVGGFAALYESADLRSWTYRGPMLSGSAYNRAQDDATWTGTMWECAELFRLAGGKDVPLDGTRPGNDYLVFSAWHEGVTKHALYWSGRYRGDQFAPSGLHPLDLGGRYFYAPQSYRDESGRRVMFGWMQDALSVVRTVGAGWAGVMSLPRLVTEADDGRLRLNPVPEVALLRGESIADSTEPIDPGMPHLYPGVTGDQFDLEVCTVLEPGAGLKLRLPGSELGAGYVGAASVRIVRTGPGVLSVQLDRSSTTNVAGIETGLRGGSVPVGEHGRVDVRIIVDHSAFEMFVNGVALSARVHPETTTTPLAVGCIGSSATVTVRAWTMNDAWAPERL